MGKFRFNAGAPEVSQYTNQLMEMVNKMAMYQWQQGQELAQKKKLAEEAWKRMNELGLLSPTQTTGAPGGTSATDNIFLKDINLESGMPNIGFRSPADIIDLKNKMSGQQFQQDVGEYVGAEQAIGGAKTGGEMSPTPAYMAARPKFEALKPRFGGKKFSLTETGKYKEAPTGGEQTITDETGKVIGTRPKGSVFQPRGKEDKYKDLFPDGKTVDQKSPYAEYPDAFLESGVWKVIKNGKKYRIE